MGCRSARRFWRHRDSVGGGLIELLRTNDLVLISRVEAILAEIGVAGFVADGPGGPPLYREPAAMPLGGRIGRKIDPGLRSAPIADP